MTAGKAPDGTDAIGQTAVAEYDPTRFRMAMVTYNLDGTERCRGSVHLSETPVDAGLVRVTLYGFQLHYEGPSDRTVPAVVGELTWTVAHIPIVWLETPEARQIRTDQAKAVALLAELTDAATNVYRAETYGAWRTVWKSELYGPGSGRFAFVGIDADGEAHDLTRWT